MTTVVLGGGLSGLTCAYKIPNHRKVILLEASNRLGGWIETTRNSDGVNYEHGPRTIRPAGIVGAQTLELVEELGLSSLVRSIPYGHPTSINRQIYVNGKLYTLPTSLFGSSFPFSKSILHTGISELFKSSTKCQDDSVYNFVKRRYGEEWAEFGADPLVRGVCGGDAKEISVKSFVTKSLFDYEQTYGRVGLGIVRDTLLQRIKTKSEIFQSPLVERARKEKWSIWTLENGLQTFIEGLSSRLNSNVEIRLNSFVSQLQFVKDHVLITLDSGENIIANDIISTIPSHALAYLFPHDTVMKESLEKIPFVSIAVVNIEFPSTIKDLKPAFGFLVPSSQPLPILGAIYDTFAFSQMDGKSVFTVLLGGKWFDTLFTSTTSFSDIENLAHQTLSNVLKIKEEPSRICVRVHHKCIPQYTLGHSERLKTIRDEISNNNWRLSVAGCSYDGVGINDVIDSSFNAVSENSFY